MICRDEGDPTSSSELMRTLTLISRRAKESVSASARRAKNRTVSPPFMSRTPGPVARVPSIWNGLDPAVPAGYTVSMCPMQRSRFVPGIPRWEAMRWLP